VSLRVLDLFSGVGLMSLGLGWAGMRTVGFCEIEPACRFWLREQWPAVPIFEDVRALTGEVVLERCGAVDLVAGGFPCQPVSVAGSRKGAADERWLWPEMFRLVRELRPRWVLAENVPGLRTLGADGVLADLESAGYACWPLVVGAIHTGAPLRRLRVWIVGLRMDGADGARREGGERPGLQGAEGADGRWGQSYEPVRPSDRPWPPRPCSVGRVPRMADGGPGRLARHRSAARRARLRGWGNGVYAPLVAEIGRAIVRANVLETAEAVA
jgi:DNA (cytosine-5)-methyltransferase 1